MAKIITLKDHKTNELAYPQTVSDAVYMDNGSTLEQYKESVSRQFANYPNVTVTGTVTNLPDNEDIRETEQHTLQFADRNNLEGMGYVILRKNKTFAEQLTKENTIYEIRYDFDLGNSRVIIPANCVLKFNGGSIKGNNTYNLMFEEGFRIEGDAYHRLINLKIRNNNQRYGQRYIGKLCVDWFYSTDATDTDDTPSVTLALDSYDGMVSGGSVGFDILQFTRPKYYITKIDIKNKVVLDFNGATVCGVGNALPYMFCTGKGTSNLYNVIIRNARITTAITPQVRGTYDAIIQDGSDYNVMNTLIENIAFSDLGTIDKVIHSYKEYGLTIRKCTFNASRVTDTIFLAHHHDNVVYSNAVTIDNVDITGNGTNGIYVEGGTVNITNSIIEAMGCAIKNENTARISIINTDLESDDVAIYIKDNTSPVYIKGSSCYGDRSGGEHVFMKIGKNVVVTIENCCLDGNYKGIIAIPGELIPSYQSFTVTAINNSIPSIEDGSFEEFTKKQLLEDAIIYANIADKDVIPARDIINVQVDANSTTELFDASISGLYALHHVGTGNIDQSKIFSVSNYQLDSMTSFNLDSVLTLSVVNSKVVVVNSGSTNYQMFVETIWRGTAY
jgi:hypothetical protein